jgi:hypothetical protein
MRLAVPGNGAAALETIELPQSPGLKGEERQPKQIDLGSEKPALLVLAGKRVRDVRRTGLLDRGELKGWLHS